MSTMYGLADYSKLFSSPVSPYQVNPVSNLIFESTASKVYSQTVAKQAKSVMSSYLSSLNSSASNLKSVSKPFNTTVGNSSFNQKSVSSSDNSAVSGTAASNADMNSYTINVSKLATSQINSGNKLNSNDKSALSSGLNTFSLKVGNNQKNISFTIDDNDTNKSSLQKMANAINYAKSGVTASVSSDSKTGTSFIKITSDKTGTDSAFSLNDVNGNAASISGANSTSTQAQNAEYTLDGKQYTSQSNTISANNGKVSFTLNKADNKYIKVTVTTDNKGIQSNIKDLVDNYNNLINLANSNSSTFSGAEKLKGELTGLVQGKKSSLANIGITQNEDGTLAMDSNKLESAIGKNLEGIKDTLGGTNGFAQKLYSKANEVLSSPLKYSQVQDLNGNLNQISNSANIMPFANSYQSRMNMYLGLVVDTLL